VPDFLINPVGEIAKIAYIAHHGQTDKIGVPYYEHVHAVAKGLAPLGPELEMAGYLHDIVEDTDYTADMLRRLGVPERTVSAVEAVTNERGVPYAKKIDKILQNPDAVLVKISDNAHNSRMDRAAHLPMEERERLALKYFTARRKLWSAATSDAIRTIVAIVNPDLLEEL
jgi:(p)ppGpp synthase/HD superfamily hydrolase